MGQGNEGINSFFAHNVTVAAVFHIGEPFFVSLGNGVAKTDPLIGDELTFFIQQDIEARQKTELLVRDFLCLCEILLRDERTVVIGGIRKIKIFLFVFLGSLDSKAACRSRRPSVFIVKIRIHADLFSFFNTGTDKIHEFIGKIGGRHAHSGVHIITAEAHFLHDLYLLFETLFFQFAVP